ncbi:endonuclease VII domain-containing protein [Actinocorallia longicatena]
MDENVLEKSCPRCGETKPVKAFGVNRARSDGFGRCCKPCTMQRAQENYRIRMAREGRQVRESIPLPEGAEGCKRCPDCERVKPFEEFRKNKARHDGLAFYCKECFRRRDKAGHKAREEAKGRSVRERVDSPPGHKWCNGCKEIKPFAEWHRAKSSTDGYASACKECRKSRNARDWLKRAYGLTPEGVAAMIESQGGLCALCGVKAAEHVDHDHRTGKVRGVLCFTCNVALGQLKDDAGMLLKAIAYLQAHGTLDDLEVPIFVRVAGTDWALDL